MILAKKYKLIEKIGNGSYGQVFKGINIRTCVQVAIKLESKTADTKLLKRETQIYQYLFPNPGIPHVKYFGAWEDYYYMVLPLLGDSLAKIANPFSLTSIFLVGKNMIELVEYIHSKGIIHRDIKPENFLYGLDEEKNLHLIDFGFCKRYIDNNGNHIQLKNGKTLIGTANFASIHVHNGIEPSRRDDLESIIYILIFLIEQQVLPWSKMSIVQIYERKLALTEKFELAKNERYPEQILKCLQYCKNLEYDAKPDYSLLCDFLQ